MLDMKALAFVLKLAIAKLYKIAAMQKLLLLVETIL